MLPLSMLLLALAASLPNQPGRDESTDRLKIIESVIIHRLNWANDSTPFDACLMRDAKLGEDGIKALRPSLRLAIKSGTCVSIAPKIAASKRFVHLTSLEVKDSTATVQLTVFKTDLVYKESYDFRRIRGGDWGIHEVRQFGMIQVNRR